MQRKRTARDEQVQYACTVATRTTQHGALGLYNVIHVVASNGLSIITITIPTLLSTK